MEGQSGEIRINVDIKKTSVLIVLALLFISGIGRVDVAPDKYLKLGRQNEFSCVGQIIVDDDASGSGVLICENLVLSAAHVFILSDTQPDTLEIEGEKVVVFTPINDHPAKPEQIMFKINGTYYKVKRITIHPTYLDKASEGACDLALLELEQSVKGIKPAILNNQFNELKNEAVGVGYGVMAKANESESVIDLKLKNAGQNVIDSIGGLKAGGQSTLLFCDFDAPDRSDCNKMGSASPLPLEYVCSGGDSGGGLFIKRSNKWVLVGICSGSPLNINQLMKTGYYGSVMFWTRVSAFTDWIEEQVQTME